MATLTDSEPPIVAVLTRISLRSPIPPSTEGNLPSASNQSSGFSARSLASMPRYFHVAPCTCRHGILTLLLRTNVPALTVSTVLRIADRYLSHSRQGPLRVPTYSTGICPTRAAPYRQHLQTGRAADHLSNSVHPAYPQRHAGVTRGDKDATHSAYLCAPPDGNTTRVSYEPPV